MDFECYGSWYANAHINYNLLVFFNYTAFLCIFNSEKNLFSFVKR